MKVILTAALSSAFMAFSPVSTAAMNGVTLPSVFILGKSYDVTFWQDATGRTTFNQVFGTGEVQFVFGNSETAERAARDLLGHTDSTRFDFTPGSSDPTKQGFVLPFAATDFDYSWYTAWSNNPENDFRGVAGPFYYNDYTRYGQNLGSFVEFTETSAVPEIGSSISLISGLLLILVTQKARTQRTNE